MANIYIDDKRYEAKPNQTIIEVAFQNGITIPHFCWHPELSISGNCRMCLVEVGMPKRLADGSFEKDDDGRTKISYFPKLQIACATLISDEMHVRTLSKPVIDAQEAVMEFLLINHPLDCPICDEAGQCKLQEYAFKYSEGESRFVETKNHKDKRQSWGPNVLFDAERCISCSRCIRFAKEIAKQDVLTFVNRNDHVTIQLFEGKEFDSPYSMNVIDICPVGALTSKDFRFKSRVWDMSFNNSICIGCSRGCNVKIGIRNNEILRYDPAPNAYVNKHWLCDWGRLNVYPKINKNRVSEPMIKKEGNYISVSWLEAIAFAANNLKNYKASEIMFLGSAKMTNEDNYLLSNFVKKIVKSNNLDFIQHIDDSFADDLLRTNDKAPNSNGAIEFGLTNNIGVKISDLVPKIRAKQIKAMYILDDEINKIQGLENELNNMEFIIVHSQNHSRLTEVADVVFASSTFAESEGTFINVNKRVQHFEPILVTAENQRYMGMKMSRLDKFGSHNDRWTQHELRRCKQNWAIIQMLANQFNANWDFASSSDVFNEIANLSANFKGMNYKLLDYYQGLILGKADKPDKKILNYVSHYLRPE